MDSFCNFYSQAIFAIQMFFRFLVSFLIITYFFFFSTTANRHLLRSLAQAGAGAYEYFDSKTKSKWEGKVCHHIWPYHKKP